jgi:hypothetical protein
MKGFPCPEEVERVYRKDIVSCYVEKGRLEEWESLLPQYHSKYIHC